MKICKVEGCNKKHRGLGYCNTHYCQFKRIGYIKYGVYTERECLNPKCSNRFMPRGDSHKYCVIDCKIIHYKETGKNKEMMDKFNHSEKGKIRMRKHDSKPERMAYKRMTSATNRKYKDIKLTCSVEGCTNEDIHKHHPNYEEPYNITALCREHHRDLHAGRLAI